jgi:ADP-heptose:LPS heptosyltransferase
LTAHVLIVRLDSMGDVLAAGPAVRAVASRASVTVLVGPLGEPAARLLPGVDEVLMWACPWILDPAPAASFSDIGHLVNRIAGLGITEAIILTSFHQSPLPTALVLRMADVPRITARSVDYPGSLLDLRLPAPPEDAPEPEQMLGVAQAAGYGLPDEDNGCLAIRRPLPPLPAGLPDRYVVVHPGTSAPARAYPEPLWALAVRELSAAGWPVVVTGGPAERNLTRHLATSGDGAAQVTDLGGRLDLGGLAAVLDGAAAVVVGNTGPAHLAAAVGTPVVSLFAPVVPAARWAPYGVPVVLLGDQHAPCRDTRSRQCPIPGHPCLGSVTARQIVQAVDVLVPTQSTARQQESAAVG